MCPFLHVLSLCIFAQAAVAMFYMFDQAQQAEPWVEGNVDGRDHPTTQSSSSPKAGARLVTICGPPDSSSTLNEAEIARSYRQRSEDGASASAGAKLEPVLLRGQLRTSTNHTRTTSKHFALDLRRVSQSWPKRK